QSRAPVRSLDGNFSGGGPTYLKLPFTSEREIGHRPEPPSTMGTIWFVWDLCLKLVRETIFFFQAEDGIRGFHVTGVQTCALPIYDRAGALFAHGSQLIQVASATRGDRVGKLGQASLAHEVDVLYFDIGGRTLGMLQKRSEERRVGEGRR